MTHAEAIQTAGEYSIARCSSKALENGKVTLKGYALVDLILGLERNDGHSLVDYKTFTTAMQQRLNNFTKQGGSILVSGAYIGSDMTDGSEQQFLSNTLKLNYAGRCAAATGNIKGMGTTFDYWKELNEEHYAATATDILTPVKPAFAALQYADGSNAAIAYKGSDYRSFCMGFPFECITDKQKRNAVMRGILNYLLK